MSANASPRSTTLPMMELGRSLEQLRDEFHSLDNLDNKHLHSLDNLDNLDGAAGSLSARDNLSTTQPFQRAPPSLDNMIGISDFRKLDSEDQHNMILSLLPLLKPFAARMDRSLEGLAFSVGLASKQLDLRDTWEKVEREELDTEVEAARWSCDTSNLPSLLFFKASFVTFSQVLRLYPEASCPEPANEQPLPLQDLHRTKRGRPP